METIGPRQRLRITFGRAEPAKYVTHLDLMRLWERLLRRAGLPVSYSASQPPRPRLALAAPLAVGVISDGELLDVFLDTRLPLAHLARRLALECPAGITVNEVQEIGIHLPSAQSLVRFSDYRVAVAASMPMGEVQQRIAALLAATSLPRQRLRDGVVRQYDLRPQVDSLWIAEWGKDVGVLGMLLQTDEQATGRPDDVLAVLGLSEAALSIQRVKLILAQPSAAAPSRPVDMRGRRAR
jgi:radical SAM-linked protein